MFNHFQLSAEKTHEFFTSFVRQGDGTPEPKQLSTHAVSMTRRKLKKYTGMYRHRIAVISRFMGIFFKNVYFKKKNVWKTDQVLCNVMLFVSYFV